MEPTHSYLSVIIPAYNEERRLGKRWKNDPKSNVKISEYLGTFFEI